MKPDPTELEQAISRSAALNEQHRFRESVLCCRRALRRQPESPGLLNNLGVALAQLGRLEEAERNLRRALRLKPDFAAAVNNLAAVCVKQKRLDEAAALLSEGLRRNGASVEALNNLATVLRMSGHLSEAARLLEAALAIRPDCAELWRNLATLTRDRGLAAEAVPQYRRAVELDPESAVAGSGLLMCLNFLPDADPLAVYAEHRAWARRHADPLAAAIRPHSNTPAPDRSLQVGYLSPDFRRHPVAGFLKPVLAAHDRERFQITCYANVAHADQVTAEFKALGHRWRDVFGLTDPQLAELIRSDGIDILVELAGHTWDNRLLAVARKPAPVQVTWLGYPNTTGLRTVDYRITDAWADPPGTTDHLHSEQLVRLPCGFSCWGPPAEAPEPSPPPAATRGAVSFGSFNFAPKITPQVIEVWAEILRRTPGARLLLKYTGLNDEGVRRATWERFERSGVSADRILLLGSTRSWREHLAQYAEVDIALDPFPYNGTTTTCEALWMGVPVVTLAGRTHAARVGVSLLNNVGLPELIADSPERYVALAVELAGDAERLARLRADLRPRMARAPLTNAALFTRTLEEAYRTMWRRWVESACRRARQ